MLDLTIRGHHLPHLAGYLHCGRIATEYPELDKKVEALFRIIGTNQDVRISVVTSLDSVCAICNKYSEEEKIAKCQFGGEHQDNVMINIFNLNKRKTYSQRKFINIVRAVPKRYRLQ